MSISMIVIIMYCLIVSQSLAQDRSNAKKRSRNRYKGMSPAELSCDDRNLHRNLVWQSPIKIKPGWKLTGYTAEQCVSRECSYETVRCYRNSAATKPVVTRLNGTYCLMSAADLLPWEIYTYKVTATYRSLTNQTRKLTRFARVSCEPVDRQMKLDAPSFDWTKATTSTISFLFMLPLDLTNAIIASNNYDLRITYSFCLYESGKTCQMKYFRNGKFRHENYYLGQYRASIVIAASHSAHFVGSIIEGQCSIYVPSGEKDIVNGRGRQSLCTHDSCNPSSTYSNLKEGKKYTISAWYTTRASGKRIRSAVARKELQTKIDYFPAKSQILLVIGLSAFLIVTIVAFVLWRTTRSIRRKWEALVHKEIPKYFEEVLKDLSKTNDAFITHDDRSQLKFADDMGDEKANVDTLKVPGKPSFWGKHFESDKICVAFTKHSKEDFSPGILLHRCMENVISTEPSHISTDNLYISAS